LVCVDIVKNLCSRFHVSNNAGLIYVKPLSPQIHIFVFDQKFALVLGIRITDSNVDRLSFFPHAQILHGFAGIIEVVGPPLGNVHQTEGNVELSGEVPAGLPIAPSPILRFTFNCIETISFLDVEHSVTHVIIMKFGDELIQRPEPLWSGVHQCADGVSAAWRVFFIRPMGPSMLIHELVQLFIVIHGILSFLVGYIL